MKDEIKEILNWLNQIIKENKESDVSLNSRVLPFETLYKLQDYITNLQEELKSANESITWWQNRFNAKNNGFKSTVEELCETTEKFEKLQEKYEKMKENAEILSKGYGDLEKRNEKAIELIKEAGCYDEETKTFCDDIWEELPELLNILKEGKQ